MRIAWFSPERPASAEEATAPLIAALAKRHAVDVIGESRAHDLVWANHRNHYDLSVYAIDNSPDAAYMWPYLLRYPGLALLLNSSLVASRSAALFRERRSSRLQDERDFADAGSWPLLWPALGGSRLTVVPHRGIAAALQVEYPDAHVASATLPCPGPAVVAPALPPGPLTIGCVAPTPAVRALVERAVTRARDIGLEIRWCEAEDVEGVVAGSHVVLALQWPTSGRPLLAAARAMAAGRPTIVFDTIETADWPAWDPQTWQHRDVADPTEPACITLDIRDDEHSLVLCLRRLSADPVLLARLGVGARAWWEREASPEVAVPAFEALLARAATLPDPARRVAWPSHLTDDATGLARETLQAFGLAFDELVPVR